MTPIDVPTPMPAFTPVLRTFCAGDVRKMKEVIEVVQGIEKQKWLEWLRRRGSSWRHDVAG
jgi:hypothetical protein